MSDMHTFIARLESAEAADGALEHEIMLALGARYEMDWGPEYYWPDGERFYGHEFTRSIDDALSLAARVAPGWTRSVDATLPSAGIDVVLHPNWPRNSLSATLVDTADTTGTHAIEAIATTIAALKAMPIAQADARPATAAPEDVTDTGEA